MIVETSNGNPVSRSILTPANEVGLVAEDEVSLDNVSTSNYAIDRSKRLERASASKAYALSNVNNRADLDNSYTDLGDGRLESNRNKIWNDLSDQGIQSLWNTSINKYKLNKDTDGNIVDSQGNAYTDYTRRLYDFGTKAQTSDVRKFGLARGDSDDATARYTKYPSGELGADIKRLYGDILLPNDVATMLEATLHGRTNSIKNRVSKDRFADPFTQDLLGGGSSEYYTSKEGAFGVEGAIDERLGTELFDKFMAKLPAKARRGSNTTGSSYDPDLKPIGNSFTNALSGFGSSFVNELLVKPLDAVGDLTGLYDLDTNGDTSGAVEDVFGYNARASDTAMENIGKYLDTASSEDVPTSKRVSAVANGMLEAFSTPELLGTSFGVLMSWLAPGAVLKAAGVGSKFAKTASQVDKLVSEGKLSGYAGKVKKAKEFMSIDGAKAFLTSQAGFVTSSLGNVNKQYEEFVGNNEGVELEGQEKAEWFAGRFAVQILNQNLDKLADFNVMKSPGVLKALVPAVKAMSEKQFVEVAKVMALGVAKTTTGAASEAGQEYIQTTMELFNSRFGSEKFKDQDTFVKFLSNEDNIHEAGIAAIAGAGGSTQFEVLGAVGSAIAEGSSLVSNRTAGILADKGGTAPTADTPLTGQHISVDGTPELTEDEIVTAKDDYKKLLVRVATATRKGGVNESNIGLFLDDLDNINRTKHILSSTDEINAAKGEAVYNEVVANLEAFIVSNQKLKLGKRLVRKTIKESLDDKTLGSKPSNDSEFEEVEYDDESRKVAAERISRAVLGSGKEFDNKFKNSVSEFGQVNGLSKQEIREVIKSYESVAVEATTGDTGYVSRLGRLKTLTETSSPNVLEIAKERKAVESMYKAIVNSEEAIGRGIAAAEQKAIELNKRSVTSGKTVQLATEYMKYNRTTKKYDVPYVINIKNVDGVYTADVDYIKKIHKTKSGYTSDILRGLQEIDGTGPVETSGTEQPVKEAQVVESTYGVDTDLQDIGTSSDTISKTKEVNEALKTAASLADDITIKSNRQKLSKILVTLTDDMLSETGAAKLESIQELASVSGVLDIGSEFVPEDPSNKEAQVQVLDLPEITITTETIKFVTNNSANLNVDTITDLELLSNGKYSVEVTLLANKRQGSLFSGDLGITDTVVDSVSVGKEVSTGIDEAEDYDLGFLEGAPTETDALKPAKDEKEEAGAEVLAEWKAVADEGLSAKWVEKGVAESIKQLGLKPKKLIESILGEKSFAKGKKDLYEAVYQNVSTGQVNVKPLRKPMPDADYDSLIAKNSESKAHDLKGLEGKFIFVGSRRVVQDMTKIVSVNKSTVANSITLDFLPADLQLAVSKLTKSAESTLLKVSPAELAEQTYSKGEDGKVLSGAFNLHNSPARALFFNSEGKINDEVMTATYLALGDMLVSDKTALSIGWKSDQDIAQMFGVQEFEVSEKMRKFAYAHGSLLKSVASKLGKNILTQLGISKRIDSETSSHEYESLVSDIGNTALAIAEHQGLLKNSAEKSNVIAELYKDGEQRVSEATTHFINLAGVASKDSKTSFTKNVPTVKVDNFLISYKESVEDMPEASTTRKGGHFFKPTAETLDKARTTVRNDISGKEVPLEAQETIQILMETAYTADVKRIDEVLDAVNAENSNVKNLLGYVELTTPDNVSPAFEKLYFKDKEVQEAKNNAIDKTLDELSTLKDSMADREGDSLDIYFDYFYASNDRYMMDANTINPQVDKLHRFLITPKDHKLAYTTKVNSTGGIDFEVGGSDQNFTVRMALTQAFGKGVDKMDADSIIGYGNVMLAMSKKDIIAARKEIFSVGKFTVESDGKEYHAEAEHLTHTLQALSFLENVQDAMSGNGKFSSSLSLEFDSLTSGFANKTQQMPILSDIKQHFARTGVLTKEYQDMLKAELKYKGEGIAFDPAAGQSMADVIAGGTDIGFLDAYKTLAQTTIFKLRDGVVQDENLGHSDTVGSVTGRSVFESIKPMLPGGESIDSKGAVSITSLIRNLFKNPFMIFNYSAGINRIVMNLSNNVANDIAKTIATKDFKDEKNVAVKNIAQGIISDVALINPKTEAVIKTTEEFQEVLRSNKLVDVKIKVPFMVESEYYATVKKSKKATNLEMLLENVMRATYGEVVDEVFNEEFKEFIEVQDAMNDTFKVAFRIFDKKRVDMLKELQRSKADSFLSMEDHMDVLEELRDDFPWIVGPLTEEGDKKATISIATTSTRASNPIEESRKKPQALIAAGNGKGSRTVTPLVKYLEEAVSSGSVLPFHAIDGSQIAKTLTAMNMNSIAAIHDAVIAPLNESDNVGFAYNKGMSDINTSYSLAGAVENLVDRMSKTINDPKFSAEYKDVTADSTKLGDKINRDIKVNTFGVKALDFPLVAKAVTDNMSNKINEIKSKREEWYGEGGKMEGAYYGNLVGTPGGMYRTAFTDEDGTLHPATAEPDLSYKEEFKRLGKYKSAEVKLKIVKAVELPSYEGRVLTSNKALIKDMVNKLGIKKGTTDVDVIVRELKSSESKAEALLARYLDKLKTVTDARVKADLRALADELEFFTGDGILNERVEDVVENTSSKDAKSILSSSITVNLKECTK